jgi:hypothetical protein
LIGPGFWSRILLEEAALTIWTIGEISVGTGYIFGLPRY